MKNYKAITTIDHTQQNNTRITVQVGAGIDFEGLAARSTEWFLALGHFFEVESLTWDNNAQGILLHIDLDETLDNNGLWLMDDWLVVLLGSLIR